MIHKTNCFSAIRACGKSCSNTPANKLPLPEPSRIWLPKQTAFFQIQTVRISPEAIFKTADLPLVHRDPFDRLLAAQSLVDGFKFISPDPPFRAFGVDCLW